MEPSLQNTCKQCGSAIPADSPDALCPACLFSLAFDLDDGDEQDWSVSSDSDFPKEFGNYQLLKVLGRGGMGKVYEAEHLPSGRRIALKMLDQQLQSHEVRQRFFREGRLAASINHPNSLYVFGSEEIEGHAVITMEIAASGTLLDRLNEKGSLPTVEAVDAILDVITGLEAAHTKGVLHRDIKPSNCFISAGGSVKVGDYGLSLSIESSADAFEPSQEKVLGTPAYASPEQLNGNHPDVRSDIYSVGATLFHLLTSLPAFDGDDVVQTVANVLNLKPKPLCSILPNANPELEKIILRCLAKNPKSRFADYALLRKALLPFSSKALEPASMLRRVAAGWMDYLVALFPVYAILILTGGSKALVIDPLIEPSLYNMRYYLVLFGIGLLYFTLCEGLFGAGIGKKLTGLIVHSVKEQKRPYLHQALIRALVPLGAVELVRMPILILLIDDARWTAPQAILYVVVTIVVSGAIVVALASPRRSGNANDTIWDRLSGTRVYEFPEDLQRPVLANVMTWHQKDDHADLLGPYEIVDSCIPNEWLIGYDPVLRRYVWLFRNQGEGVPQQRRNLARPGKLRWLQEVRDDNDSWDVFGAPEGMPFRDAAQGDCGIPWKCMKYLMESLASELWQSDAEGLLPEELSIDQIWMTQGWQVKLLDRAWPGLEPWEKPIRVDSLEGQLEFLERIASEVDEKSLPIHAGNLIRKLSAGRFDKLSYLAGSLRAVLQKPTVVDWPLRLFSEFLIPLYVWMAVFVGYFHDKPKEHFFSHAVLVTIISLAGYAALQLIIVLSFRTSPGHSIFQLAVAENNGELSSRITLFKRYCLCWGTLFVPMATLYFLPINTSANLLATIWLIGWLVAVIVTMIQVSGNWIDSLTKSFVVRQ